MKPGKKTFCRPYIGSTGPVHKKLQENVYRFLGLAVAASLTPSALIASDFLRYLCNLRMVK